VYLRDKMSLQFSILDDLRHTLSPDEDVESDTCGPIIVELKEITYETVNDALTTIVENLTRDPTLTFMTWGPNSALAPGYKSTISSITNELLDNNYYVNNRCEKYYVLAIALNYTRFEVFSKDCDKELIKWRDNDENDPVVHQLGDDDEYNVNPVIKAIREHNKVIDALEDE
jgi:hypothetical protein